MMTLKTIKSGDPEIPDIDIGKDDIGYYYLSQGDEDVVLTKKSLSELGQYLSTLDLDW